MQVTLRNTLRAAGPAALASLPHGAYARDPGLNQPGVVGNVGGVARRSVRL